jgi:hypothetical protein
MSLLGKKLLLKTAQFWVIFDRIGQFLSPKLLVTLPTSHLETLKTLTPHSELIAESLRRTDRTKIEAQLEAQRGQCYDRIFANL